MVPPDPPLAPRGPALLSGGRGSVRAWSTPSQGPPAHRRLRALLTNHHAQPRKWGWGPHEAEGH